MLSEAGLSKAASQIQEGRGWQRQTVKLQFFFSFERRCAAVHLVCDITPSVWQHQNGFENAFHTDKGYRWITQIRADTSFFWCTFHCRLLNGQSTVAMTSLHLGLGRNRGRWWGRSGQQQSCSTIGWGKWCNGFHWPHSPRLFKNWSQTDEWEEPRIYSIHSKEVCKETACVSFQICNTSLGMANLESPRLDTGSGSGSDLLFYIEIDAPGNCWSWCITNMSFMGQV